MQIDRLNHLQFPPDSKVSKDDAADQASAATPRKVPELPLSSAVVVIKSEQVEASEVDAAQRSPVPASVYTVKRPLDQADFDAADAQAAQQQAQNYERALERSSDAPVQLKVDKDGVMVSRKSAAPEAAPADFVTAAVQTMRDFANETERQKSLQNTAEGSHSLIGGSALRGLQHLTQRFKLFA